MSNIGTSNYESSHMESSVGAHNKSSNESLEEKEKQIHMLQEEKNRLEQELSNLRGKLFSNSNGKNSGGMNKFALWQIIAASIISLIIGSFLST